MWHLIILIFFAGSSDCDSRKA